MGRKNRQNKKAANQEAKPDELDDTGATEETEIDATEENEELPPQQTSEVQAEETKEPQIPQLEQPQTPPKQEEPVVAKVEEPVVQKVEEPVAPKVEEPVVPKAEVPVVPKAQEPVAPKAEEPVVPKVEEVKVPPKEEEPPAQQPKQNGIAAPATTSQPGDLVEVTFEIPYNTAFGEKLVVTGSANELGNWNPNGALELSWTENNIWVGKAQLAPDVEYKYVLVNNGSANWENGDNRKLEKASGLASYTAADNWIA